MKKVILIIVGILIMIWVGLIGFDYFRAGERKAPLIVVKKSEINYSDGPVTIYYSLGYKYIDYRRTTKNGYEFGGFWLKVSE